MAGIYPLLRGRTTIDYLSMATAYAGTFFLAAALIIGPLNVLRAVPIHSRVIYAGTSASSPEPLPLHIPPLVSRST
jgi:hypothetical protein